LIVDDQSAAAVLGHSTVVLCEIFAVSEEVYVNLCERIPSERKDIRLSNTCQTRQKQSNYAVIAIASRSVSPNNYDRDGKNKISPASEQEGQNLLHYLCVCNSGFRLRRLPNRPCPGSGHWRHGGPSPAIASGMKAPVVRYEDVAARAGLTGKNVSGAERGKQYIVETTGTGVAIFDYDNDGLPDIFLVNADRLDETAPKPTHFLYHNLGGLKFEDVTQKAGLAHTGWGQGVCVGDIDNDGNPIYSSPSGAERPVPQSGPRHFSR